MLNCSLHLQFVNFQFNVTQALHSRAANSQVSVNLPRVAARLIIELNVERSLHLQLLARRDCVICIQAILHHSR